VILRLEELGIMHRISVISAVSGGSIVAAYYAFAMERELRSEPPGDWYKADVRARVFKKVARKFLKKVRMNMRSKALVFTPFYHPWLFVKSLALRPFRSYARSILIQGEYDRHFYDDYTLDQLPAVPPGSERDGAKKDHRPPVLTGPKLLLNTTSLMTGERKAFSRERNTYLAQLKSSNKNVLKLSQVVGASSGVPVLFPPTSICGELLVDGGVSDNQGIEGLLPTVDGSASGSPPLAEDAPLDTFLISDASGQLELKHTMSTSATAVFSRVNDVLMHQVRNKLLDRIAAAKNAAVDAANRVDAAKLAADVVVDPAGDIPLTREPVGSASPVAAHAVPGSPSRFRFAFVHLLLNLKDDPETTKRISSVFIGPLAGIRTDLDQFSYIEAEALMYHGYTTIDAMMRRWCSKEKCPDFKEDLIQVAHRRAQLTPPLFLKHVMENPEARTAIRSELVAGREKVFLVRYFKKIWNRNRKGKKRWNRGPLLLLYALPVIAWLGIVHYLFVHSDRFVDPAVGLWHAWFDRLAYTSIAGLLGQRVKHALATSVNGIAGLAGVATVLLLSAYVVVFFFWAGTRHLMMWLDHRLYRKLTGDADPESLDWVEGETVEVPTPPKRVSLWRRVVQRLSR
jgi:hypothetical protein